MTKKDNGSNITKNPPSILELKNVSKIYQVGTQTIKALDNINFDIKQGDFVAITGPSGSGKSTFLQVASMLSKPSSGKILLKGQNVTKYDETERAQLRNKEIGFVFQQFNLLPRTSTLDNVALPLIYAGVDLATRQKKSKKILTQLGLADRLENRPNELSGGQKQRVAIARALVNNPSIIFADEPTGNLGSKSGKKIEEILLKLHKQGRTIILVSHEKPLAKIAEKIICLNDGKLAKEYLPPYNKKL